MTTLAPSTGPSPVAGAANDLDVLFRPRGVVVVGASEDPDKLGGAMAGSLAGFPGDVALVNARGVAGMSTSITDACQGSAGPVDLAVLCVPAAACADAVRECADAGVGAALVCAGGFAEAGGPGVELQDGLAEAVASTGVRLLGPNTSGFFAPGRGLVASFVPSARALEPGRVAVVAASGGLNHALAFAFQRRGVGLSLGVGIGTGLDVDAPDVVRFCADDPDTAVVALHLETVSDGPALLEAVAHASRRKPVVALVVGQHDIGEFAQSHTGALATSWRTTRALLGQAGAVVVDDEQALVTAATVLASTRAGAVAAPAAGLVTAQAGPGLLVADALHDAGVGLPGLSGATRERLAAVLPPLTYQANPVDTGRPGPRHHEVLSAVAADAGVDLLAVYALAEPVVDLVAAVTDADLAGCACVIGVDGTADDIAIAQERAAAAGVAMVVGPTELAVAVDALAQDARRQHELPDGATSGSHPGQPPAPITTPLTEASAKDLLAGWGVPTPERRLCRSLAEAHAALEELGAPVAVKVSSATVLHKSDIGGVRLGVATADEMTDAFTAVGTAGGGDEPEVLVERMASSGTDLILAARRDPVFGPVVVLGVGGVATEVYSDVAISRFPASRTRLAGLTGQLRGRALLEGFRGAPPVPTEELARLATVLGEALLAHPELDEIEINPLRAVGDHLVALDAVVVGREAGEEGVVG